jgi:uncharacterized protein (TIGR02186 family)
LEGIKVRKGLFIILFGIFMSLEALPKLAVASIPINITVQPDQILIGASYNGADIRVSGEIQVDTEAFIRVLGHLEDSRLKKKGRALGFLWMNLGSVEFHKVPSVFLLYPPKSDHEILESKQQTWQDLEIGLKSVQKQALIVTDSGDKDALFEEFVKLKQKSGLYDTVEDSIHYKDENQGVKSFSCSLKLPSDLPQGVYKVEVFAFRQGDIAGYGAKEIRAKEDGMPAIIAFLAFNHGTLYGILAVLVAVIAGLLTGILFKGEKGSH